MLAQQTAADALAPGHIARPSRHLRQLALRHFASSHTTPARSGHTNLPECCTLGCSMVSAATAVPSDSVGLLLRSPLDTGSSSLSYGPTRRSHPSTSLQIRARRWPDANTQCSSLKASNHSAYPASVHSHGAGVFYDPFCLRCLAPTLPQLRVAHRHHRLRAASATLRLDSLTARLGLQDRRPRGWPSVSRIPRLQAPR